MGHRLITWWNPNNAWHRAAAEAALKAIGARWLPRDADEEGQVVGGEGSQQLPSSQVISAG